MRRSAVRDHQSVQPSCSVVAHGRARLVDGEERGLGLVQRARLALPGEVDAALHRGEVLTANRGTDRVRVHSSGEEGAAPQHSRLNRLPPPPRIHAGTLRLVHAEHQQL